MSTQEANLTSRGSCSTRLCNRCLAACFDDSRKGGSIALSQRAEEILEFPFDHSNGYRGRGGATLPATFALRDWLPRLPVLSASTGCDLCCFLRSTIMESKIDCQAEAQEISLELSYGWWPDTPDSPFALYGACLEICLPGEDVVLRTIRFTIDSQDGEIEKLWGPNGQLLTPTILEQCQRWLRVQPTPSPDFLNQKNINEISAKLDKYPPSDSDFFPTRVIDLGATPGDELKLVKKHESLHPHYAALSYCWGTLEEAEMQFKTLRCNLKDRRSRFKLSEVSPVIKDAVVVCRAFGVRYLWVDAVCIIQDDAYDWEQESPLMAMIFRSAYFVIAAVASDSCNEGFLSFSRPFIHLPFQSKLRPGLQGAYRLVPVPPLDGDKRFDPKIFFSLPAEDYLASRWCTRGWVYQERVIARRVLLCGRTGLWAQFHDDTGALIFTHAGEGHLNHEGWCRIVSDFSATQLTRQTDRLPAISGLAKLYQEVLQDEYLAGLWRSDLFKGLFWQFGLSDLSRRELITSLESPDPYIAPSWSWARERCGVCSGLTHILDVWQKLEVLRQEFALLDVKIDMVGSNPFGQLRSGQLTLRSKVLEVPSNWDSEDKIDYDGDNSRIKLRPDWNWILEGGVDVGGLTLFLLGSCIEKRPRPCYCHNSSTNTGSSTEKTLHKANSEEEQLLAGLGALKLGESGHVEQHGHEHLCLHCKKQLVMYGLVLHPAKESGKFFRVGIFVSDPNIHALGGMSLCEDWETRTVEII